LAVERGSIVRMHYRAMVGDRLIDTTHDREPIEFKVGEGQVIEGLDEAVIGLKKGDKKTVIVPPEKAYGERQEDLTGKIPVDRFRAIPPEQLKEGTVVQLRTLEGIRLATILRVDEDGVTLDFNHPLAGQTIKFEIEIVDVKE
jgi:FKBP-type peptidyl-prolyl cis-trans isomerase 2